MGGIQGSPNETCETKLPLLITHVETTSAPVSDDATLPTIHAELDRKALLPGLASCGYGVCGRAPPGGEPAGVSS